MKSFVYRFLLTGLTFATFDYIIHLFYNLYLRYAYSEKGDEDEEEAQTLFSATQKGDINLVKLERRDSGEGTHGFDEEDEEEGKRE